MKHSEVLKRYVNTGSQIPEKQYEMLSQSLRISYMRMRDVVGYGGWELKYLTDDKRIKFIEKKGEKLKSNDVENLLEYSKDKDLIETKIIEIKGDKLVKDDVDHLLKYSKDKDLTIKKFIEVGLHIKEEQYKQLSQSLQTTYMRMREIVGYQGWEFKYLTDDQRIKFIEKKGEELTQYEMLRLLENSNNKNLITTKIIDIKGVLISKYDIFRLFDYSEDKDFMATKIIKIKGEELQPYDISQLLKNSKDKELIKKLLLQNGVDYKLINKVITNLNMDTSLIPDNYQETLNEIKRIKEIMR